MRLGFGPVTTWHTATTAAKHVKVNPNTIREAVKNGDLPAYPVGKGREYRLREEDVDSWLMSRSGGPADRGTCLDLTCAPGATLYRWNAFSTTKRPPLRACPRPNDESMSCAAPVS
jgi:excisionase family DNA binding protein